MQQVKFSTISYLLFMLVSLLSLTTCVREYPLSITGAGETFLVVNAVLNHSQNPDIDDYKIRITKTQSVAGQRPIEIAILQAKPELIVNDKDVYPFTELDRGFYEMFNRTIFKTGSSYKLRFIIDNTRYESTAEILPDSAPIQKIYAELKEKPTAGNTFDVFVDVQDKPEVRNYYKWAMIQWERQQYCAFCYANQRVIDCYEDLYGTNRGLILVRNNSCKSECFDILRQNPNNTIGDAFFNGKQLIKKSVGDIAYNFPYGTLVEVRQSSITSQYFDFTELLKSQSQNTGGLIDVPPALLQGNIKNLSNPAEVVIGFFSVTNTLTRRLWVNRSAASTVPLSSNSSRIPPVPTPVPPPPEWNPLPCVESNTRTGKKPFGWID